jgi:HYDIN/CFA65/VesB-like, Ig-like domain
VRRASIALGVALGLGLALTAARAEDAPKGAPTKPPRLSVEPAAFDFGKAVQNKTLQKEFSIRNFGGSDLVIEGVSTTCGCTAALLSDKVVKPGGSTPLRVSVETRSYSGKMERTVLIRSNDPEASTTEVKVSVTVVPAEN